jgi:hypothetical protein
MDDTVVADIDQQLEHGIGTEPRCAHVPQAVDAIRESALSMGPKRSAYTIRSSEKQKHAHQPDKPSSPLTVRTCDPFTNFVA